MKTGMIFTGSGPILIITSYESLDDPKFAQKLAAKGIKKYVAYELPIDIVKEKYGAHFTAIVNDTKQQDDLRVLDYNGHNVFYNFTFVQMGKAMQVCN